MDFNRTNGHGHHTLGFFDTGKNYIPFISNYLQKNTGERAKRIEWLLNNLSIVFFWLDDKKLKRLSDYLKTINTTSEERLIEDLKYHDQVVCIVTDLHYMGTGEVPRKYEDQIQEAIYLKNKYGSEKVKIFMMLDPNRPNLLELVETYQGYVDGWKLYPTWYFVTDKRLREIYDKYPKPTIVHCTDTSPVFWQGSRDKLKKDLGENYSFWKSKKALCKYYSHPKYINKMAGLYPNASWSAAHLGGENEDYRRYVLNMLGYNIFADEAYTIDTARENREINKTLENYPNIIHGTDYFMIKIENDYENVVGNYICYVTPTNQEKMKQSFYRFLNWK